MIMHNAVEAENSSGEHMRRPEEGALVDMRGAAEQEVFDQETRMKKLARRDGES